MRPIDADNLKDQFSEIVGEYTVTDIQKIIDNALTVDERPQGKWIEGGKDVTGQYFYDEFICNKCSVVVDNKSNFCPRCGADMRGAEPHLDNTQTVTINKDFYKIDKSNPINRSDLFQ